MIFDISKEFAERVNPTDWCEVFQTIASNRHFILKKQEVYSVIKGKLTLGGAYLEKIFKDYVSVSGFNPTHEHQRFLTTVTVGNDFEVNDFKQLASHPAYLICENNNYEWDIYKHFIELYTKDKEFKNIFLFLNEAAKSHKRLEAVSCGGNTQLIPSYNSLQKRNPTFGMLHKKCCFLFDRDTDFDKDPSGKDAFSYSNDSLFKFLNDGKKHDATSLSDIYTLDQPKYVWHMWYKRAIENYMPDYCYESFNVDISDWKNATSRDYFKVDKSTCRRYDKSKLHDICKLTSKEWLDNNTGTFEWRKYNFNEIQLFLLKLVKII